MWQQFIVAIVVLAAAAGLLGLLLLRKGGEECKNESAEGCTACPLLKNCDREKIKKPERVGQSPHSAAEGQDIGSLNGN